MGAETEIAWCDATFNPHWGCQRVSPGCENCYAEAFAKRTGHRVWGPMSGRREFSDAHWAEPREWNAKAARAGVRRRVFCASMADVFEDHPVAERSRERLWPLIEETKHLDWLLLTKRPENMNRFTVHRWGNQWPAHVWAGCTVEDQRRADDRIPELLNVPARVRFLSCEPLLERVVIHPGVLGSVGHLAETFGNPLIHWVIVGGESGPGARPFNITWARDLIRQCRAAGAAVFMKQAGAAPYVERMNPNAPAFDDEMVFVRLKDRKGGDWNEWTEDLRVRELP